MANPFKQADMMKKKAPGSKQEPAEEKIGASAGERAEEKKRQEEPLKSQTEALKAEKPAAKATTKAAPKEKEKLDIFSSLSAEKPTGKTYAFYLSEENAGKLKKLAEKKGVSVSKLLDHILSEVL